MELIRYWQIVRRWWWLLLLGVVLGAGIAFIVSTLTPPTYRSTARLLVNQVQTPGSAGYQDLLSSGLLAKTYNELLKSRPVLDGTIKQYNLPLSATELSNKVTVSIVRDTQLLQVAVDDTDPVRAAVIANGLAQVFIDRTDSLQAGQAQTARKQVDQEIATTRQQIADTSARLAQARAASGGDPNATQQLQGELTQYQDSYLKLLESQQRMALTQAQDQSSVTVAEPGVAGIKVGPRRTQNTLLAGFIGLLLAVGAALLITYLDDRVHDPEEIRALFNVPPLATVRFAKPRKGMAPGTPLLIDSQMTKGDQLTEAMRLLRTNVGFLTFGDSTALCVSSAVPGEGKSTITANLALAEAQAGKRVAIIDCDLRKPGLHPMFGLPNEQGLSTFLAQTTPSLEPVYQEGPLGIRVLTSGPVPPNPTELLGSQRMVDLIARIRPQFDVILLDSAPILHLADTLVLQSHVDGMILVINVQSTGTKVLRRIFTTLEQASGKVLGVVLNKDRGRVGAYGYGYSNGYGYGYGYGLRAHDGTGTFRAADGSLATVTAASDQQQQRAESAAVQHHDD